MGKSKTAKRHPVQPDDTKYYRAKYWNPEKPEDAPQYIVFSGRNIQEANEYAQKISTPTMALWTVDEYTNETDAMIY